MRQALISSCLAAFLVFAAPPPMAWAQQTIEGTVVSTVLTACDMKPGTCEGSLVLDTKGKDGKVTVKVPKGTQIKKGKDHLFLPGLKGNQVVIGYASDKGARVAKSIEVKSTKP